jgi:uncharacterized membrane protein
MNPVVASVGDDFYNVLLAVHIGSIIAAFGPTLVYILLSKKAVEKGGEAGAALASISPVLNARSSLPALVVAMLAGIGLILQSDEAYTFEKPWVSASFTIVLVLVLLSWFFLTPMLKRLQKVVADGASPDEIRSARGAVAMATGLLHLGMTALLILMIWKPGQVG